MCIRDRLFIEASKSAAIFAKMNITKYIYCPGCSVIRTYSIGKQDNIFCETSIITPITKQFFKNNY